MISNRLAFATEEPVQPGTAFLFAVPYDTPTQRFVGFEAENVTDLNILTATNGRQQAFFFRATTEQPRLHLTFEETTDGRFPPHFFTPVEGPHERPSADLIAFVQELAPSELSTVDRAWRIIRHVEERFTYGKRPVGLGDDAEAMPALTCGIHQGTCVDSHSYTVAALRATGIEAAYISGIFFPAGQTVYPPGHCWVGLDTPGLVSQLEISHHIEYDLGPVTGELNPKPGTRFAMSQGRDLVFEIAGEPLTVSILTGFIVAEGEERGARRRTLATLRPQISTRYEEAEPFAVAV